MDRRSQVLVIGAGPSGLVTAALLARAGRRVTVIDPGSTRLRGVLALSEPGLEVLRELGWLDRLEAAEWSTSSRQLVIGSRSGLVVLGREEQVELLLMPRAEALRQLTEEAMDLGVTMVPGYTAVVPMLEGHRVVGIKARDDAGSEISLGGDAVVDATGASAFLATSFGQLMPRKGARRAQVEGVLQDCELQGPALGLVERSWLLLSPRQPALLTAVVPERAVGQIADLVSELVIDGAGTPDTALIRTMAIGAVPRTAAGHGWVAVGQAAGRGCPGLPGLTSAGLAVAASAAWEIDLAIEHGRVIGPSQLGATLSLSRQSLYLESLLDRALVRAADAGLLGLATSTPRRRRVLGSMLLGRWVAPHGRLARVIYLWWLDHRSRRAFKHSSGRRIDGGGSRRSRG